MSRIRRIARVFLRAGAFLIAAALLSPILAHAAGARQERKFITPPPGWLHENLKGTRAAALGYVLAQWLSFDRGSEEYIEVGSRSSYGFTDESFTRFYRVALTSQDQRIYAFRRQRLCNNEVGWYVKHRGTRYPGLPTIEDVYFVDGAKVYFASYNHSASLDSSVGAERAISSLCVPFPLVARKPVLPVKFTAPPGWLISDPRHLGAPVWPGTLAYYFNPSHREDILMLVHDRAEGEPRSTGDRDAENAVAAALKREKIHMKTLSWETYGIQPLCNGSTGWLLKYTIAFGRRRLAYEHMMLFGPELYSAVYIRPASKPAFKPASASLRTLCPIASARTSAAPQPTPLSTPTPVATPTTSATP